MQQFYRQHFFDTFKAQNTSGLFEAVLILKDARNSLGAFQIVATITNRRQRFQRLTGLGVRCSLRQFEIHPILLSGIITYELYVDKNK